MTRPDVSAVMVSWRTGPALWEAIAAALAAPDITELVLVNNGNAPETERRLRALDSLRGDFVLVEGQGNVGFARGCNLGVAAASGAYLLFLNPDAVVEPGAAERMAEAGARARRPWAVGARLINPDGAEQRGGRRGALTPMSAFVGYSGLYRLQNRYPSFRNVHREAEPLPSGPALTPVVSGAALMMRADDFAELGGFDESYFLHVEDIDLCRRLDAAGGQVVFHPHARVLHYGSTSQTSLARVEWAKAKGFIRYFWKFAEGPSGKLQAILVAPLVVAAIMARALVNSARRRFARAEGPADQPAAPSAARSGAPHWRRSPSTTSSIGRPLE